MIALTKSRFQISRYFVVNIVRIVVCSSLTACDPFEILPIWDILRYIAIKARNIVIDQRLLLAK